jgi:hypothetical protein
MLQPIFKRDCACFELRQVAHQSVRRRSGQSTAKLSCVGFTEGALSRGMIERATQSRPCCAMIPLAHFSAAARFGNLTSSRDILGGPSGRVTAVLNRLQRTNQRAGLGGGIV